MFAIPRLNLTSVLASGIKKFVIPGSRFGIRLRLLQIGRYSGISSRLISCIGCSRLDPMEGIFEL